MLTTSANPATSTVLPAKTLIIALPVPPITFWLLETPQYSVNPATPFKSDAQSAWPPSPARHVNGDLFSRTIPAPPAIKRSQTAQTAQWSTIQQSVHNVDIPTSWATINASPPLLMQSQQESRPSSFLNLMVATDPSSDLMVAVWSQLFFPLMDAINIKSSSLENV